MPASDLSFLDVVPLCRRMQEVLDQRFEQFDAEHFFFGFPEHRVGAYGWITHQKFDWMVQTAKQNQFATDYFVWMDAGAGHGTLDGKMSKHVCPCSLANPGMATLFTDQMEPRRIYSTDYRKRGLRGWSLQTYVNGGYRVNPTAVIGTFFGGDLEGLSKLFALYNRTLDRMLQAGFADDEQQVLAIALGEERPSFVRYLKSSFHDVMGVC
mmetsp:Transcript_85835/g.195684  ORF Transcript_85835/g.195684 Transcript_85835/m.195684 type:complete len:210 (+) Transcript_85835:137-766(+)